MASCFRPALFRKLQALSYDFHRTQPSGDVIYRLMLDSPGCEQTPAVWIDVAGAVVTLCVMFVVAARNHRHGTRV